MSRLTIRRKAAVAAVGLLFVVVFGLVLPWWLFLFVLFSMLPLFYKLLVG